MQIEYYDGQFDDARYAVALATTAALQGAAVLNHARVESLIKDSDGHVTGVRVRDDISGHSFDVKAKVVINATGPFTDAVRSMSKPDTASIITPSAGALL